MPEQRVVAGQGSRPTPPPEAAQELQNKGALDLRGMAVGWRDDHGAIRLDHTVPVARSGAVQGALTGGVVGLFLLAPLLGAAVGGAAGAIGGKLSQLGLDKLVVGVLIDHNLGGIAKTSSSDRPLASTRRE